MNKLSEYLNKIWLINLLWTGSKQWPITYRAGIRRDWLSATTLWRTMGAWRRWCRPSPRTTSFYQYDIFISFLKLSKVNSILNVTFTERLRNCHLERNKYWFLILSKTSLESLIIYLTCTVGVFLSLFYTWTVFGLCRRLDTCLLLWGCVNKLLLLSQGWVIQCVGFSIFYMNICSHQ